MDGNLGALIPHHDQRPLPVACGADLLIGDPVTVFTVD
jgi:hypothetical protein